MNSKIINLQAVAKVYDLDKFYSITLDGRAIHLQGYISSQVLYALSDKDVQLTCEGVWLKANFECEGVPVVIALHPSDTEHS